MSSGLEGTTLCRCGGCSIIKAPDPQHTPTPTVAIVGVHGVGKSYTAQQLEDRYGFRYVRLEAISEAQGLHPTHRQVLFFTKFVSTYIEALTRCSSSSRPVVFDSHPILVIPYTRWWLRRGGCGEAEISELIKSLKNIVIRLPKLSMLVYLRPQRVETVINRIKMRSRFNFREELDVEYIKFIDEGMNEIVSELGGLIADKVLVIKAEVEGEVRAERIHRFLFAKALSSTGFKEVIQAVINR